MPIDAIFRTILSLGAVIGLLAGFVWFVRRGGLRGGARAAITVETATSIGERRSLVIVTVEGRRLLLGVTPGSISMIAALDAAPAEHDR